MYPYLTGSASWLLMTMVTEVCGIRGVYGDLCLAPRLVRELLDENLQMGVELKFAGVLLHIRFQAGQEQDVYTEAKSVVLDGELLQGNIIRKDVLQAAAEREILVKL